MLTGVLAILDNVPFGCRLVDLEPTLLRHADLSFPITITADFTQGRGRIEVITMRFRNLRK